MASLWNIKIHPLFLIIYVTTDLSTQSSFYIITGRYKYIIFFFKFWETNSSTKKIYQAKIIIIFSIKEMFSIAFNLVLLNIFNSWKKFYFENFLINLHSLIQYEFIFYGTTITHLCLYIPKYLWITVLILTFLK